MRKQLTVLHTTSTVLTNIGYSLNPLLNYLQREKREDATHNIFNNKTNFMQTITKQSLISFYLEYVNNFLTIKKMAEHYDMDEDSCEYLINMGKQWFDAK